MQVINSENIKSVISKEYNFIFDKNNGDMFTWGETPEETPIYSPFGPTLMDIEVTTKCDGIGNYGPCSWCYKANTPNGKNMSFYKYKEIIDKLPVTVCQVAIGADAKCRSNPDLFGMLEYTRENDIIPNITVADIDSRTARKLSDLCGAVACSYYGDKNICYGSIQRLVNYGMKQVNIHRMICQENMEETYDLINDYIKGHEGLQGLNAIVFLSLKQRGRGKQYTPLIQQQFTDLINYSLENNVPIGMDSCSTPKFLKTIEKHPNRKQMEQVADPCESSLESFYCSVDGELFPCSFVEGIDEWKKGINISKVSDFIKDVWFSDKVVDFRNKLLYNRRNCPKFNI